MSKNSYLFQKQTQLPPKQCRGYPQQRHQEGIKNEEIPPDALTGGWLKINIVFCSKLVILHATKVN